MSCQITRVVELMESTYHCIKYVTAQNMAPEHVSSL